MMNKNILLLFSPSFTEGCDEKALSKINKVISLVPSEVTTKFDN